MQKEIKERKDYLNGANVETIYFGGGTPSLLQINEIQLLLEEVFTSFNVIEHPEITLEGNPDDLTASKIKELQQAGINRLSIGVQSFNNNVLKFLGRIHDADTAENSIKAAQDVGITNLTIDYIYNIPGLSKHEFEKSLQKAAELNIPHFSAYALTIEPKTAFHHKISKNKMPAPDEEQMEEHFFQLLDFANENGYSQYEISNFCKEGMKSSHNSSYWEGKPYLGIGPSAHSFNGNMRRWNLASNYAYIKAIGTGNIFWEEEILSPLQKLNEYLMISLRTEKGCNLEVVKERQGKAIAEEILANSQQFLSDEKLVHHNNCLVLTSRGKLISDYITSHLFIDEE